MRELRALQDLANGPSNPSSCSCGSRSDSSVIQRHHGGRAHPLWPGAMDSLIHVFPSPSFFHSHPNWGSWLLLLAEANPLGPLPSFQQARSMNKSSVLVSHLSDRHSLPFPMNEKKGVLCSVSLLLSSCVQRHLPIPTLPFLLLCQPAPSHQTVPTRGEEDQLFFSLPSLSFFPAANSETRSGLILFTGKLSLEDHRQRRLARTELRQACRMQLL